MAADDLYDNVTVLPAIRPDIARLNGSVNGPTIDRRVGRVFFRSVMFAVQTGLITEGVHTVNVQESPDGTTWSDVPASRIRGAEPVILLANDNATYEFAYTGASRYLRLQLTTTGATVGGFIDGVCLLGIQSVPR